MAFDWRTEYHRYHRYFVKVKGLYDKREVVVYTGLILTLLTISFFALFAIKPTVTTIAQLFKEIERKREVDQKLQTKINTLRQAQTNYSLVSNKLALIDQALPQEPELTNLIYQLEILAQQNNVQLRSLRFEPAYLLGGETKIKKKIDVYPSLAFNLSFTGEFENVYNFLDSLEDLRRNLDFENFTARGATAEETRLFTLTINLQLKSIYLSEGNKK